MHNWRKQKPLATLRAPEISDPNEHFQECDWGDGLSSWRVGKKAAGRLLDGVQHDGYPGSD